MLQVTSDLMARYALRIGADFKIIRQENHSDSPLPRPHAVKFYVAHELDHFDRVLWIDADCLVSPDAPSLFDAVPTAFGFAAWCDEIRAFAQSKVTRPRYAHGYFNSGVMLASTAEPFHQGMRYLRDKETLLTEHERAVIMGEQTPLNKAVHDLGIPVFQLGPEWNFLMTNGQCRACGVDMDVNRAHIVHCAGGVHLQLANPRDRSERAAAMQRLRDRLGW